ncbi:hypothetical protein BSK66_07875 [Paenibacillus odorifer]|uniref:Uncharacterized protein n=1 Tax=Paenibacillus odorifer TaxID=189426 RepID=A0A1R0X2P7_9BACL|nr:MULTISPECIES: hypothetical protein [Paenibacillus]ETT64921.1 hypothetical protein C171_07892 [Paenibacillus sp. FSL H8-237]OMD27477.1 hypothetical protein BJP51_25105 [Paenibacillus odorifer]OME61039.1 hypothetical protein BSK66_07875 [Paenibacillus odorifer]
MTTQQTAQIIPFPCVQNEIAAAFDAMAAQARAGLITGAMFAISGPNADPHAIMTGWHGVDIAERSVMLTHMQFDLIAGFIGEE